MAQLWSPTPALWPPLAPFVSLRRVPAETELPSPPPSHPEGLRQYSPTSQRQETGVSERLCGPARSRAEPGS